MRVLLINLTRFGDLLQTQAVVHGLRAAGHDVGIVCLNNFAAAADFLDGLSHVAPLPGNELLAALDAAHSSSSPSWLRALATLRNWADSLRTQFLPDAVLNLTSTPAARLLASCLAEQAPVRGFYLDDQGFGLTSSAWAAFFEASTRTRGCSPFNIVDVFLRAAELSGPAHFALRQPVSDTNVDAESLLPPLAFTPKHGLPAPQQAHEAYTGYIGFQLGASEARRQWPAAYFAALGTQLLASCKLMPVLFGSKGERPLADAYTAAGGPGIDLVGRTSLPELAAALTRTRMLITNDTGTMHLAAGLGVPLLGLFMATAQPWDTGPYLVDSCSLEPALDCHPCAFGSRCTRHEECTAYITPETVWPLLYARLTTGEWTCPPQSAERARVWLSRRDSWGYMELYSLSGHDSTDRCVWIAMQRLVYRHFLDELDRVHSDRTTAFFAPPCAETQGADCSKGLTQGLTQRFTECLTECLTKAPTAPPSLSQDLANMAHSFPHHALREQAAKLSDELRAERAALLAQALALLELLHELGQLTIMRPSGPHGQRFLSSCHRLGALFESQDAFNALGRLWQVMSQEHGGRLADMLTFCSLLQRTLSGWQAALAEKDIREGAEEGLVEKAVEGAKATSSEA